MISVNPIKEFLRVISFIMIIIYYSYFIISCSPNSREKKDNIESLILPNKEEDTTVSFIVDSVQNPENTHNLNKIRFYYLGNKNGDDIFRTSIKKIENYPFDSVTVYFRNITSFYSEVDSLIVFTNKGKIQVIQPKFTLVTLNNKLLQENIIFDHYNADEFIDFKINTEASGNGMAIFQYYVYDRKTGKYEYSLPLSKSSNLKYDKKSDLYKSSGSNGGAYSGTIFKLIGTETKIIKKLNIEISGKHKIIKFGKNGIVSLDTLPQEILNDQIEELIPEVKSFWNFDIQK